MSTFEVVRGPEGDCLLLDDTRISGPKPWGGGTVTKTFQTDEAYAVVPKDELDKLKAENARLRERCADLYAEMITYSDAPSYNASVWAPKLRKLGVEVDA